MGVYDKIEGSRPSEGGLYFEPGTHVVLVNRWVEGQSRKNGEFLALETFILETDSDKLKPKMPATQQMMCKWDGYGQIVMDFAIPAVEELFGQRPSPPEITKEVVMSLTSKEQPVSGRIFRVNCFRKEGKDFLHHRWSVLKPDEKARYEKLALDLGVEPTKKAA